MDVLNGFLTQFQLQRLIDIPFEDIEELLEKYIQFKGLVFFKDEPLYVDGFFVVEATRFISEQFTIDQIESGYALCEPDQEVNEVVISIKGTEHSNDDRLLGVVLETKSRVNLDEPLYSFEKLREVSSRIGLPSPRAMSSLLKKEYLYDVDVLNEKSNFTLKEMVQIASNTYSEKESEFEHFPNQIEQHYLETISDCIKGTNQHGFKLHTQELWTISNDEFGEPTSKFYENGTFLRQRAKLDYKLTSISKSEFIRWCDYQEVDTGLVNYPKEFPESIERLECENNKLRHQNFTQDIKLREVEEKLKEMEEKYSALQTEQPSKVKYPCELQLAIDAYEALCLDSDSLPKNADIEEWLIKESKERGIVHIDDGKQMKGLSNIKLNKMSSIIKSKHL